MLVRVLSSLPVLFQAGAINLGPEGAVANTTEKFALWFRRFQPNPDACLRLFCFPFAGGGTLAYRSWASALAPAFEVYALQLPGREHRFNEQPFDQLLLLVRELVDTVSLPLNKPFAFFGHSLGALISFELARHLLEKKLAAPAHLFVSAWRAPHLLHSDPVLHQMPEPKFIEELKRFDGTPEPVLRAPDLMKIFLPILRADFKMFETYSFQAKDPIACPITAFGGMHDSWAPSRDLVDWKRHTSKKFRLKMFPGGHFYIHQRQQELFDEIAGDLRSYY
jgi:medium-chain acyl-[acyl-carrier-protein] hydrolase